jgi:predicted amidohydrolase
MRIALIQTEPIPGDVPANLHALDAALTQAAHQGARLALTPELTDFGYDLLAARQYAVHTWPATTARMAEMACRHGMYLACGVAMPQTDALTNALALWNPQGDLVASYAKLHLFSGSTPSEAEIFYPGKGPVMADIGGIRIGLAICFDLRFPELFRLYTHAGCSAVVVAAAWPKKRGALWQSLLIARAAENAMGILGANHTGSQPFALAGGSAAVTPLGEIQRLDQTPGVLVADLAAWPPTPPALNPTSQRRSDLYRVMGTQPQCFDAGA